MDFENKNNEIEGEAMDLGFTKELVDEIRSKKEANPGMFVSAWQEDSEGIEEKDMDDPVEKFLTAAEDDVLDEVERMYAASPKLLEAADRDGYTALHRAAYNNNLRTIDFLLAKGVDTERRTKDGWTAMHSAANWGNYEAIGKLLSHGANVNAVSNGNLTALHLAVSSQCDDPENVVQTVRYLLQASGVDPSVVNGSGDTPLALARRSSERIYNVIRDFLDRV